ncbi:MAG: potassium channel family protein [Gemmatimonadota bacterium]
MRVLLPVIGTGMLLLLAADVFFTVFSPHGRGGPVNRRQTRALWAIFRATGRRRDGSARERWLSLAAPLMVVSTLAVWVLWLVLGFALVYYPWIESFLVSPGTLRAPWVGALYYSGYTAATLGLGDVVARSEALRLLTVVEAFGGFALLSISVTYFLAIYRELVAMQSLASDISGLFSEGEEHVLEFTRQEGYEALARWCEQLSGGLSRILLAHFQYPVLHYFRPRKRSRALPVQLGSLLTLRGRIGKDSGSEVLSTFSGHPSYLALTVAVDSYLDDVDQLFVPGRARADPVDPTALAEREHARLMSYMLYT